MNISPQVLREAAIAFVLFMLVFLGIKYFMAGAIVQRDIITAIIGAAIYVPIRLYLRKGFIKKNE